ncbi:hypothetical protein ACFY6U_32910 [Streptomyces sp. NPDC013157]|uniref:hypothetical protein n=1 Tax=Streptomyces sp. NPDC013157 TaxID=3364861 RepID=UPI00367F06DD
MTAGALNTAGSSISASGNDFVYQPYCNGLAATKSALALRTDAGAPAAAPTGSGTAADRNLAPLRTAQHQ